MSGTEKKLADTNGKFAQVVKEGRRMNDVEWQPGRILLSTKRLVLAGADGKRTIALASVDRLEERYDVNQTIAQVSGYVSLRIGEDVLLVAAEGDEDFELTLYKAFLDDEILHVKHPAIKGGVVQDAAWQRARTRVQPDAVNLGAEDGSFIEIEIADVSSVERQERSVRSETRPVIEVEHTEDAASVETYVAGSGRQSSVFESLVRRGEEQNSAEIELSAQEKEVLMALYSGVSPFEIPEFVGMDVDDAEETFERLIELDVLKEVRIRREVALKPRGRNIASEAINDQ